MSQLPPPIPARPHAASQATSGLAIVSLIAGLMALFGGFTGFLAIIFGHIALSKLRRQPGVGGRGLAVAGLILGYILSLIFAVFWLVFLGNVLNEISRSAGANGEISELHSAPDSRLVNGELDYGVNVTMTVKNKSESEGKITIKPWLSCSEGKWSRSQELVFRPGESKELSYFFHEPTINASNIQAGATVEP